MTGHPIEPPRRTIKEIVADGFQQRQWVREQKRQARIEYAQRYKARKEREAALAIERNSAISSAKATQRAELPDKSKAAGGNR